MLDCQATEMMDLQDTTTPLDLNSTIEGIQIGSDGAPSLENPGLEHRGGTAASPDPENIHLQLVSSVAEVRAKPFSDLLTLGPYASGVRVVITFS
ncbi:unnamed protein product, partial [Rhizoctonia solani]